jgi:hypothetical protein
VNVRPSLGNAQRKGGAPAAALLAVVAVPKPAGRDLIGKAELPQPGRSSVRDFFQRLMRPPGRVSHFFDAMRRSSRCNYWKGGSIRLVLMSSAEMVLG